MKIIVTGASGMSGSEVVRQAILDKDITEIYAISRKPIKIEDAKLKTIILNDFMDYSPLTQLFKECDAIFWCLGISQYLVTEDEYIKITYDYAIEAAKTIQSVNPDMTFIFLSGMGTDSTEKSKTLFARIKGKTENQLMKMNFKKMFIVRPGGIQPIHKREKSAWYEALMIPLYPIFKLLMPNMMITSVELAQVMLYISKKGSDQIIMENKKLKDILKFI